MVQLRDQQPLVASYGFASEDQGIENGPDVVYDIGSLTKQFTGAAILKLEMMQLLSVNDSLGVFFKDLQPDKGRITLHQLLTHSSGLPYRSGRSHEAVTREQLLEKLSQVKLAFMPGDSVLFSDFGYNLLGLVIERVSGASYESFLKKHLFDPAGMKQTGYIIPAWSKMKVSHGYRNCKDWGRPMELNWSEDGPHWNLKASGGLLSTANDLMLWHQALSEESILDRASLEKLYGKHVRQETGRWGHYGYGWKVFTSSRKTTVYAHDGFNGRYFADFLRYVDDGVTILVLSNKYRFGNPSISFEIASCLFTPGHRPVVQGKLTLCLDSLPDNRPGQIAAEMIRVLETSSESEVRFFMHQYVASHLMNKYPEQRLLDFLMVEMAPMIKGGSLQSVTLTDFRLIDLEFFIPHNGKRVFVNLILDEHEDYKIRGMGYDDERPRPQ